MSETKFTPGPWSVGDTDVYCEIYDRNGNSIAGTCATSCDGDMEIGLSNANLIAAAPEMYEMLEDFVSFHDRGEPESFHRMVNVVKELLAKARGESC